jgi:hypothetical protein
MEGTFMHHPQCVRNRIDAALSAVRSTSALGHLAVANPKRVFAYVVDAGTASLRIRSRSIAV